MMMQLLAEASTIDAGAVGQIISTLVGAGAIGGGGYVMGKARKISLSNDPLNVRKANEYATKEDIARLEREIRDIKMTGKKTWETYMTASTNKAETCMKSSAC